MIEMEYKYVANVVLVANANNPNLTIVIDADSDFQCIWLIASSSGTFKAKYTDGATGRAFMSGYVNNVNGWGTAQLPYPMLPPYVFKRQASIVIDVTDTSGAGNTIQFVFAGKKLFPDITAGAAGQVPQAPGQMAGYGR